jgi:hypothetical protein
MTAGFDKPLYVLPFDHRTTFESKMYGRCGGRKRGRVRRLCVTADGLLGASGRLF